MLCWQNGGKLSRILLLTSLLLASVDVLSQSVVRPQNNSYFEIDIPAQSVAEALNVLAQQAQADFLFSYSLAKTRHSNAVVGRYTVQEALDILLQGSGLSSGLSNDGAIVISERELPALNNEGKTMGSKKKQLSRLISWFMVGATASGGVVAQGGESADDSGLVVEEMIVTAQRHGEQSLSDTPISISVLQGSDMEARGFRSITDALDGFGGLKMVEDRPGTVEITVRGVGDGTASYYLDESELPTTVINFGRFPDVGVFDLERLEVLRGPQGTLYGGNALSGIVRIITTDANLEDPGIKLRTRVSSTEKGGQNKSSDLMLNVPIIEGKLGVRGVASYSDLSGFIDYANGNNANTSEVGSYRLKTNAQPTEEFSLEFTVSASRIENGPQAFADKNNKSLNSSAQPEERDYDHYALEVVYDFESFSVLSATSYMELDMLELRDLSSAGLGDLITILEEEYMAQEIRVSSLSDSAWKWSFGGRYQEKEGFVGQDLPAIFPSDNSSRIERESVSLFGDVTHSLNGQWDITVGLRYFDETVESTSVTDFSGMLPPLNNIEGSFDDITGRLVLTYYPQDDLTLYASLSDGFRGGKNQGLTALSRDPDLPATIDPDKLTSFEVGVKGNVLGGRLVYDIAAYYYTWDDIQQTVLDANAFAFDTNAGTVSGPGIDLGLSFQVMQGLTTDLSVGWNDLTFDDDQLTPNDEVEFAKGSRINGSPEYIVSISADYIFPLGDNDLQGHLSLGGNYLSDIVRRSALATGGIFVDNSDELFRARFSAEVEAERWTAGIFVDNLTNENGRVDPPRVLGVPGEAVRYRPRTAGVQFTYNY